MEESLVTVDAMLMSWLIYVLALIRASGMVIFAPFFGAQQLPTLVRVGIAAFFALLVVQSAADTFVVPPVMNVEHLVLLAAQEMAMGLVMSFFSGLVFMGAQVAGQLVGQQIGFAMANILDPVLGQQISLIGFFNQNLALMIFLVLKLHLLLILVLKMSFAAVPIGGLVFGHFADTLVQAGGHGAQMMFLVGLQLSMPVLLVGLMESTVEGFVTRTMPQMNIMVLGLPLRVTLGLTMLLLTLPFMVAALSGTHWSADNFMARGETGILRDAVNDLWQTVEHLGKPPR